MELSPKAFLPLGFFVALKRTPIHPIGLGAAEGNTPAHQIGRSVFFNRKEEK
jgi:hypothetical protein